MRTGAFVFGRIGRSPSGAATGVGAKMVVAGDAAGGLGLMRTVVATGSFMTFCKGPTIEVSLKMWSGTPTKGTGGAGLQAGLGLGGV
jgi:hypothetical protein